MKWFKRKPKNRRFERANVLEVKMHSKLVHSARVRMFTSALAWTLGTLITILLVWRVSEWALNRFVYTNPTFAIEEIEVQTDGIIPLEQLREWTGVKEGENLFAVDIRRLTRDLKLNTLIQDAAVERVLPGKLWVRITEREPVVQFTKWQQPSPGSGFRPVTFYFDSNGVMLMPTDLPKLTAQLAEQFDHLPRMMGVKGSDLAKGRPVEEPMIRMALQFIEKFGQSEMSSFADLVELDITSSQVIEVTTRQGSRLTFGHEDLGRQLRRWRAVHDYTGGVGKAISTLDLSVSNNVPARWQEAGLLPASQPQNKKPSPYKKKHV